MIGEIALCVGAVVFAALVDWLIPLLIQLRKSVAESEQLLARMNAELPLLLKEIRAATENTNSLIDHAWGGARSVVEHAAVLLHAAGAVGDTIQRVHETIRGGGRSMLVTLASMVAGFRATTAVVKAHIHREGGMVNGKGGLLNVG